MPAARVTGIEPWDGAGGGGASEARKEKRFLGRIGGNADGGSDGDEEGRVQIRRRSDWGKMMTFVAGKWTRSGKCNLVIKDLELVCLQMDVLHIKYLP